MCVTVTYPMRMCAFWRQPFHLLSWLRRHKSADASCLCTNVLMLHFIPWWSSAEGDVVRLKAGGREGDVRFCVFWHWFNKMSTDVCVSVASLGPVRSLFRCRRLTDCCSCVFEVWIYNRSATYLLLCPYVQADSSFLLRRLPEGVVWKLKVHSQHPLTLLHDLWHVPTNESRDSLPS